MDKKQFLQYEHGKLCLSFHPAGDNDLVLLCHGMASSKASRSHQALRPLLHKDGISTLALDFYAHGESDGSFEQLTITKAFAGLRRAYAFAEEKGYRRMVLVGSSFSGVIALLGASQFPQIQSVVLKCPVFNYPQLWHDRIGEKGVTRWRESGTMEIWKKHLGYGFYADALTYDLRAVARSVQVPVLLIHGNNDTIVPLVHSQEAYALLSGEKQLHVVNGADHFFKELPHFKELISVSHGWIRNQLQGI